MAGQPQRRERIKQAEATAEDAKGQIETVRLAMIRKGLDPADFGVAALTEPTMLSEYDPRLPLQVARFASAGQSIEEIRVLAGFTEGQERDWCSSYVDFSAAIARIRAREEAFWHGQARQAAKSGDRPGFNSITALIDKRFNNVAIGNAADLLHVHVASPLSKPGPKDD